MAKIEKGDFPTFLNQNKKIVFKVCQLYCQLPEEREDLAQEIIIQLWKAFPKYNLDLKASTWTYRIALNVAISYHRKMIKRKESPTDWTEALVSFEPARYQEDHRIGILYDLINQLSDLNKAIILLYLEDYNYKEIAAIVGLTQTNVASKVNRIKIKLKNLAQNKQATS